MDLGLIANLQNKFQIYLTRGQSADASSLAKITTKIVSVATLTAITAISAIMIFPLKDKTTYVMTFIVLGISILVNDALGISEAIFRSQDQNSKGIYLSASVRLVESAGLLMSTMFSKSFLTVSLISLFVKILGITLILVMNKNLILALENEAVRIKVSYRSLFRAGVSYSLLDLSSLLSLQGVILVLGFRLDPKSLVLFASSRTIFRLLVQFTNLINYSFSPELTKAYALRAYIDVRRLIKLNLSIVAFSLALGGVISLFFLNYVFIIWTHHSLSLPKGLLVVGLVYTSCASFGLTQRNLMNSISNNLFSSLTVFLTSCLLIVLLAIVPLRNLTQSAFIIQSALEIVAIVLVHIYRPTNFYFSHHK
jgi:O-antigen/teichoic acid export membrane protein